MDMNKEQCSWQFGRLLNLRPLFKKDIRWRLGNDRTINFWKDKWVSNSNLQAFNNSNDSLPTVSDFINPAGS